MESTTRHHVAIVGMAGRFPGAHDIEEFWQNLVAGVESITFFTDEELRAAGTPDELLAFPTYVRAAPIAPGTEDFEPAYFGMSTREAEILDPQHRAFLEASDSALQHAGYDPARYDARIGVFGGVGINRYRELNVIRNADAIRLMGHFAIDLSNTSDYVATQTAYRLGLRGPALTTLTACSTSLVAVHTACRALQAGECEIALAGGVDEPLPRISGYFYEEGGIFSPDGHARVFDARAKGTIFGSGVGIVVLKRLDDALADRDTIHAVIRGSAINNDGSAKGAFAAPSVQGQVRVITDALARAGVSAADIGYVEAHGTGTLVGDPIEVNALTEAFRAHTSRVGDVPIASVKSNVGHLGAAAGVTGLIKTVLCLSRRALPASLNFEEPNPAIDFGSSPFYVNTELAPWKPNGHPLLAGVSSFGVGGTNAHMIVEEAPARPAASAAGPYRLIPLSARTPTALTALGALVGRHLEERPGDLADAAHTLSVGRTARAARGFVVADDPAAAAERLAAGPPAGHPALTPPRGGEREVVFMFPGQGAQYAGMGRELYDAEPVFRAEIDACAALVHDWDLREKLFGGEDLNETAVTQPAVFAVEYALACLLRSWGVEPAAMVGHSIGEYVAACLAGVFTREEAMALVVARGALMQGLPRGDMLAVPLAEDLLVPMLVPGVDLAAVNAPDLCVVSGPAGAVAELREVLSLQGVEGRPLHTSHAFHSAMVDPILDEFAAEVAGFAPRPPALPYVSNVTGTWVTAGQATDPRYWSEHLRRCVRFGDAVGLLTEGRRRVLVEVGPGTTLTTLARRRLDAELSGLAVPAMRHPQQRQSDVAALLTAVGQVWQASGTIDWDRFWSGEPRSRIPLPTYPYERQRCWAEPDPGSELQAAGPKDTGPYYVPVWRETALPAAAPADERPWIVFSPGCGVAEELVRHRRAAGLPVVSAVPPGADGDVTVDPRELSDHSALLEAVTGPDRLTIVHGWSAADSADGPQGWLDLGFYSVLNVLQALTRRRGGPPEADLVLVSTDMNDVSGQDAVEPAKAALLGLIKLVPKELTGVTCRGVDFSGTGDAAADALRLAAEIAGGGQEDQVAYRGRKRWIWGYDRIDLDGPVSSAGLRDGGVYVITGGLGGLGLVLARDLVERVRAKLVLVGRTGLPERADWDAYLAAHGGDDAVARRIRKVRDLGDDVLTVAADVADVGAMREVRRRAEEAFGPVDGVFHAAGVSGGGMLETRSPHDAAQVFAPKVGGLYAIEEVFGDSLDLLVLYSSIAVVSGDFGLGDYCAANAVMDAYAHAKAASRTRVLSINWPIWFNVGMAHDTYAPAVLTDFERGDRYEPVDHPLLDSRLHQLYSDEIVFVKRLSEEDWEVDEHRLEGLPTMPGTGLVEIIRAGFELGTGNADMEIRDVVFMRPLTFEHSRNIRVVYRPDGEGGYHVTIGDADDVTAGDAADGARTEYTRARVRRVPQEPGPTHDLGTLRALCDVEDTPGYDPVIGGLTVGAHWDNIRGRWKGEDAELVLVEQPGAFLAELPSYGLHPSMLDSANALGQSIAADARFLPFGYDRIVVRGRFPERVFSHIRHRDDTTGDMTRSDITIMDAEGGELVAIEGFTLLAYDSGGQAEAMAAVPGAGAVAGEAPSAATDLELRLLREADLEFGIQPEDGSAALRQILGSGVRPQLIMCPDGLGERLRRAAGVTREALREQIAQAPQRAAAVTARNLATPYVEPASAAQRALCGFWQDSLGVDRVGVDDDFFDLGGNSLIAVQLVARIREHFRTELAVAVLFECRTVRNLAADIEVTLAERVAGMTDEEAAELLAALE
ncbi:acyltransferase domain-containing protein [Planomonospora sp. ID67723]|uniref:type I polyketide synthase n=1 Tax=Planomonospora sp. ID67723 TaxID=2738134 RepID=UPI0018C3A230|nr:type I polyketide synthase [Planomonospora sp. ID67723]MBG0832643.1 acyltransferase domain-containing protein [Planomonospora sp. ID67723]